MDSSEQPPATALHPEFVTIGHVTRDLTPEGYRLGGTATYATLTAARLGLRAALVTRAAPLPELGELAAAAALHNAGASTCTTFANVYRDGQRVQYLHARAAPVAVADVPLAWRRTPLALLGPVAQEVPPAILDCFSPTTLCGVTPQGWIRAWDARGRVRPTTWRDAPAVLGRCSVLIMSEEDVGADTTALHSLVSAAPLAAVTLGQRGADIYERGRLIYHARAYRAHEVDPTGAGDVFAAAFLIGLGHGGDPCQATDYACCVAAFAVEAPGTHSLPTAGQVRARMAANLRWP